MGTRATMLPPWRVDPLILEHGGARVVRIDGRADRDCGGENPVGVGNIAKCGLDSGRWLCRLLPEELVRPISATAPIGAGCYLNTPDPNPVTAPSGRSIVFLVASQKNRPLLRSLVICFVVSSTNSLPLRGSHRLSIPARTTGTCRLFGPGQLSIVYIAH